MRVLQITKIFLASVLTTSVVTSGAFAQSAPSAAKASTVVQMKTEFDKLSQAERATVLQKALEDQRQIQMKLAEAQNELKRAATDPTYSFHAVHAIIGFFQLRFAFDMVASADSIHAKPRWDLDSKVHTRADLKPATFMFLASSMVQVLSGYLGQKSLEKRQEVFLSKVEINQALEKVNTIQASLNVEAERIELLRNFYGINL